ncbi:hypothetical protein ALC62_07260 [Cyphomyrmex costatus]|uniref:Uncharacterized protein n=1 Tax=Cyphomyrmex costatus TaxID=456900 RepID=A0A195CNA6_9HYME|nr:hypothetical protein ALC62_07260 [Cyphomyrmex costatus]
MNYYARELFTGALSTAPYYLPRRIPSLFLLYKCCLRFNAKLKLMLIPLLRFSRSAQFGTIGMIEYSSRSDVKYIGQLDRRTL